MIGQHWSECTILQWEQVQLSFNSKVVCLLSYTFLKQIMTFDLGL